MPTSARKRLRIFREFPKNRSVLPGRCRHRPLRTNQKVFSKNIQECFSTVSENRWVTSGFLHSLQLWRHTRTTFYPHTVPLPPSQRIHVSAMPVRASRPRAKTCPFTTNRPSTSSLSAIGQPSSFVGMLSAS